jgi:small subunit ribosomal protein S33
MSGLKFSPVIKALIADAAKKCFGELPIVQQRTGNKILRRKPYGPIAEKYYPEDLTHRFRKAVPGYLNEQQERRIEAINRLKRRGKGPPQKGKGKRALKKK